MLTEFLSMWDGHLGRIIVAEHWIKLLNKNTQPVHSACNRAGPKIRKIEKSKIEKMLALNIVSSVQTEWTTHTEFASKKNETWRFPLMTASSTR